MLRSTKGLFLATAVVAANAAPLRELDVIDCSDGDVVDIEVRAGSASVEDVLSFDTRAYHFQGSDAASVPGATIKMHPGQVCTLRVTNNLVGTPCGDTHLNDYHCPDTHTLHTHGLHVSPDDDNINTHIEPNGGTHDYVYHLPEEHLMGTHWYHAHHHGSTSMQVGSGMAGVLLVEPHESYTLPADLDQLYNDEVYGVPPMLFFHHQLEGFNVGAFGWLSQEELLDQTENNVPINLNILDTTPGLDFYSVNGQYNPTVTLTQNVTTLLRMVHGGGNKHITLTVNSDSCSLLLIARDGVFHSLPYVSLRSIHFVQGTRADVAIRCTEEGDFSVSSSSTEGLQVETSNGHDQADMFHIEVVPLSDGEEGREMPTTAATLPSHLDSLLEADDVFVGGRDGVEQIVFSLGPFGINGVQFPGFGANTYVERFCLNHKYEMQLGNRRRLNTDGPGLSPAIPHPYHQHINHFQIVSGGDPSGEVIRDGEWRDVAPAMGVIMRFRPVRYTGEVVMHCHFLQHEDNGMMGLYLIEDCETPAPPTTVPTPAPPTPAPVEDPCGEFSVRSDCEAASACDGEGSLCEWNRFTLVCSCPTIAPTTPCTSHTVRENCRTSRCPVTNDFCTWTPATGTCAC